MDSAVLLLLKEQFFLLYWSNQNISNRRSAVQWYFHPLWWVFSGQRFYYNVYQEAASEFLNESPKQIISYNSSYTTNHICQAARKVNKQASRQPTCPNWNPISMPNNSLWFMAPLSDDVSETKLSRQRGRKKFNFVPHSTLLMAIFERLKTVQSRCSSWNIGTT